MNYEEQAKQYIACAETALQTLCERFLPENSAVCRAARYSLLGGGKRVRAVLVLAVCDMLAGDQAAAQWYAAAVEMLHCYSLIHDDLPCMDDDDFRRGKPSCHKAYGEATAMLAGDALLTTAFEVIANAPGSPERNLCAVAALAKGAGSTGMVYGQELDLANECKPLNEAELRQIHRHKTGDLINAACQMGCASAAAGEDARQSVSEYAYNLGLVFQIVDDVLDVTSTPALLGKPTGSDQQNQKTTYVTLLGAEKAEAYASQLTERACAEIEREFGEKATFLMEFAKRLVARDH